VPPRVLQWHLTFLLPILLLLPPQPAPLLPLLQPQQLLHLLELPLFLPIVPQLLQPPLPQLLLVPRWHLL